MDRRSQASPMDFEWQTQGPVDVTSPFYKLTQQVGPKRGFESPIKPSQQTRQPQSFFSSSAANTGTPFRNPSFTTPQKPFDHEFFSETSGAESSPADNADTEETPDPKPIKQISFFPSARVEKKPIFGKYGLHNTSARTDLRRGLHVDYMHRARKRKKLEKDYSLVQRRGSLDSGSENENVKHTEPTDGDRIRKPGFVEAVLDGLQSRPNLPFILSYYCQLLLNWSMVALLIYFMYSTYSTIRADVDKASEDAVNARLLEISACSFHYTQNECKKGLPAMQKQCLEWEICMRRDGQQVGRAQVSAQTFAGIFNSFVEPISWKAMGFVAIIFFVFIMSSNLAFGMVRSKAQPPPPQGAQFLFPAAATNPSQEYHWNLPPQTPRHISGGQDQHGHFHSILPSQTPAYQSPKKVGWLKDDF